jgi:hypothetical protein
MKLLEILDSVLTSLYMITGDAIWNYYIGTFLLALGAVLIGEFTVSVVFRVNRSHLEKLDQRLSDMKALSQKALEAGDENSYRACNKEANEAFGRSFFNKFGLSAASLWPCFFALAWMQHHFLGASIPIPLVGLEVGYFPTFVVAYIAARIFFGKIKHRLPYFRRMQLLLMSQEQTSMGPKVMSDRRGASSSPVKPAS